MKHLVDSLNATPSKRLFLSIIADYDLNRSICELVDNALDVWVRGGKAKDILVEITLDGVQQAIVVQDNAGGLDRSELKFIVGPGQTGTAPTDETIGIFGVGTKRAVVALAQNIKIKTRHLAKETFQVEFDDDWLSDDDWGLPLYEVDQIARGTTIVELTKLRIQITAEVIALAVEHLSATYAKFLQNQHIQIKLNGTSLTPKFFDNWAYPPKYSPRRYTGRLSTEDGSILRIEVIAGLSNESSPASGEYGVYFYCNDRLVARALKTLEVGFTRGLAGVAHPKVSLTKVLVSLNGDARAMPWNSSKSDISTKHEVFRALHGWLVQVVKDFASLSRIWMGDWPTKVFKYRTGSITDIEIADFPTIKKSFLPPLPKSRPRYGEVVTLKNKALAKKKPWTKGLYEGVIAADLIFKQRLEQKNRIALIVLDSTLEIAFKEYLVNDSGAAYSDAKLLNIFGNRHTVHAEIKKYVRISGADWKQVNHFYNTRCKLIHEKATSGISDDQVQNFRGLVERLLTKLYKIKFD